jgi:3-oxoacyl-(acyl-carrier-protein) synthase
LIVVTGASSVGLGPSDAPTLDPSACLRSKKTRKFMGTQDDLAVLAAAGALAHAGLTPEQLGERAGLFAVVGYIPFNRDDIDPVLADSLEGERFSMARFSSGGFQRAHPLLTFRCLPNMPAFHVSANFNVQGPYFVSYPGVGQIYAALEEACVELEGGRIDVALAFGVAHQRNFLVQHHFSRIEPPLAESELWDAGACLVLERAEHAARRGAPARAQLVELSQRYTPHAAISEQTPQRELVSGAPLPEGARGPASLFSILAAALASGGATEIVHTVDTRDHVSAQSRWRVLA